MTLEVVLGVIATLIWEGGVGVGVDGLLVPQPGNRLAHRANRAKGINSLCESMIVLPTFQSMRDKNYLVTEQSLQRVRGGKRARQLFNAQAGSGGADFSLGIIDDTSRFRTHFRDSENGTLAESQSGTSSPSEHQLFVTKTIGVDHCLQSLPPSLRDISAPGRGCSSPPQLQRLWPDAVRSAPACDGRFDETCKRVQARCHIPAPKRRAGRPNRD